jgi:hypothetical protein
MPVPDFSPGEVLTAAAMDSIGLWLVKTQTIGNGVGSQVVTGAFSADYDNYKIIVSGGVASTTGLMTCQLGSTVTGYYWGHPYYTYGGVIGGSNGSNTASFSRVGLGTTSLLAANFDLSNPFTAKNTVINYSYVDIRTNGEAGAGGGIVNNTTSYTDFTLSLTGATMTGGTIRVYGYRN